jgi:hypothetical protein
VGLGSDFDGVASFPAGLDEASLLPNLTKGLLARGWSEAVVRKVLGENLLRAFAEVEQVAARLGSPAVSTTFPAHVTEEARTAKQRGNTASMKARGATP